MENTVLTQAITTLGTIFATLLCTYLIAINLIKIQNNQTKEEPKGLVDKNKPIKQKTQQCKVCGRTFEYSAFYSSKTNKNGIQKECRECNDKRRLANRKKGDRDKVLKSRIIPEYRQCNTCGKTLHQSLFNRQPKNLDGLHHTCRQCNKDKYNKNKVIKRTKRQQVEIF